MQDRCIEEIHLFHQWFQSWFRGEDTDPQRPKRVLVPEFSMITPRGNLVKREALLNILEKAKNSRHSSFEIWIQNPEVLAAGPGHALVRYEEWQKSDRDPAQGRISTAWFLKKEEAPCGAAWGALQETWLPAEE